MRNMNLDGSDITIITTGGTVKIAIDSITKLQTEGISRRILNMHTIKPLDKNSVIKAAKETGYIITVEEYSIYRWGLEPQ